MSAKEERVKATLEKVLGVRVEQHDDNSRPSMYDLEIRYEDRPWAAIEVTSDADERALSTLGTLTKRGRFLWQSPRLGLTWGLHTRSDVLVQALEGVVEDSLAAFEAGGLRAVDDDTFQEQLAYERFAGQKLDNAGLEAWRALSAVGVIRASASEAETPAIAVFPELGGGSWDGGADLVVDWIEEFCARPASADNLAKLERSGAAETHLAVFAHLSDELWAVCSAIEDRPGTGVLPSREPQLPAAVGNIWLFTTPSRGGALTWSRSGGWQRVSISG
ncbi:hypothetical protein AB0E69_02940 [Kribbella sp. NPDC026611]|uniref:hypothetical protein n=1 Tax=Kribbella sp. NPDC026611 TaxID=3154911 RepID=UPI0033FA0761